MSHEVYENDKVAYVEGSDLPWHNENCVTFKADESLSEQWDKTSLNYTVRCEPLQIVSDGREVTHRAVCRDDNNDILGIVGPRWEPMQPREVRDILQQLVDEELIKLHTAGSLRNGARMWAQCEIVGTESRFEIVPGDELRRFYLIAQGFDGLLGVHCGFTDIRTVCANTMRAAIHEGRMVRIKHNRLVVDNVRELIGSIDWESQELRQTIEQYQFLASRGVNRSDLRQYVRIVLNVPEDKEWDELPTRTKNIVQDVERLFTDGKGNANKHVQGTWYAAYNGVTEYYSHHRGRSDDNRLDYLWFGSGRSTLDHALQTAVKMADLSSVA